MKWNANKSENNPINPDKMFKIVSDAVKPGNTINSNVRISPN